MKPSNRTILKFCGVLLWSAVLANCSETEVRYRDTGHLERPPEFEGASGEQSLQKSVDPVLTTLSIQQGLGDKVAIEQSALRTKLIIKESFEKAWFIMELVLNQQRIEITDRDRDAGYYYVRFDPNENEAKGILGWLFKDDDYIERIYSLQLSEGQSASEITADIVTEQDEKNPSIPGASEPLEDIKKDGPDRLLQMLYKKLRDGIPKHQRQ
jgi:outer membrane protein assembly factor BamC